MRGEVRGDGERTGRVLRMKRGRVTGATPGRLWAGVWSLAFAEMVSWGVLFYAFGVLLPAMEAEFGLGRAGLSGIFSGALLVAGLTAAHAGHRLDRWGARRVMSVGAIMAVGFTVWWSRATSVWELAVVWLGIGFTQALVLYEPAFAAVTAWFADVRSRSRALLAITLVGGFASTVFLPLSGALAAWGGWRDGVLILAGLLALITIPIHLALPDASGTTDSRLGTDTEPVGENSDRKTKAVTEGAVTGAGFGWLTAAFSLHAMIYGALVVHVVPLLMEAGRSPVRAAAMAGMFGVFQVAGRLLVLTRWSTVGGAWRLPGLLLAQTGSVSALALAEHDVAVWVFVALFGASNGLLTLARPLAVAEWHGVAGFGAAAGRLARWTQTTRAAAPVLAGALHTALGGYSGVIAAMIALGVGAIFAARRAERMRSS